MFMFKTLAMILLLGTSQLEAKPKVTPTGGDNFYVMEEDFSKENDRTGFGDYLKGQFCARLEMHKNVQGTIGYMILYRRIHGHTDEFGIYTRDTTGVLNSVSMITRDTSITRTGLNVPYTIVKSGWIKWKYWTGSGLMTRYKIDGSDPRSYERYVIPISETTLTNTIYSKKPKFTWILEGREYKVNGKDMKRIKKVFEMYKKYLLK